LEKLDRPVGVDLLSSPAAEAVIDGVLASLTSSTVRFER
jgi:hypothetical protein